MSDERGFTLIEVLVALAIFSLAALALLRLSGATLSSAAGLETQAVAQIVARNVAVETLTDPVAPALGVRNGIEINAGRRWGWVRRTSSVGQGNLQRIEIGVLDDSGRMAAGLMVFRSTI